MEGSRGSGTPPLASRNPPSPILISDFIPARVRRVAKVSIGVFVESQILLSAGGALTRGVWGDAPPKIFENLGSQKPHFLHFETHFR